MPTTFLCGHERSPENTKSNGGTATRCRTCHAAWRVARKLLDPQRFRVVARDRQRKYRGGLAGNANARKDVCPAGHDYSEENTYLFAGARQCKECRRGQVRASYVKHSARRLASSAEWRQANPGRNAELARAWAKANPERAALTSRLKKQRRRAAGELTRADWRAVLDTYGAACLACGSAAPPTIDHVVPISQGGANTAANVQPLCGPCNSSKGTKTVDYRPLCAVAV